MTEEVCYIAADSEWEAWPRCPRCAASRQCSCPVCETAGSAFPLADYQVAPAPLRPTASSTGILAPHDPIASERPLLRCTICDEIFAPQFYRRCHACGHDFPDGISSQVLTQDEVNARAVATVAVLVAAFIIAVGYFWFLLQ